LPRWVESRIWNEDDDVDPVGPIMDRFPGPVAITDSKQRRIAICVGVTFFVAVITWGSWHSLDWRGDWGLGQAMGFAFAAVICVGVELSVVSALFFDLGSLTLDAEGFEVRSFWTRRRRSWKDVNGFEAEWFRRYRRVSYINTSAATNGTRFYQSIFGNRETLRYTYGFGRGDFARLLTLWRERGLALSR
jgi:hypothetical protein